MLSCATVCKCSFVKVLPRPLVARGVVASTDMCVRARIITSNAGSPFFGTIYVRYTAICLSGSLAAYYFLMMTPKPSIHWAHDPHTPQMLYP